MSFNGSGFPIPSKGLRGVNMIKEYIQTAMEHAKYKILQDDGTYFGEIKECVP